MRGIVNTQDRTNVKVASLKIESLVQGGHASYPFRVKLQNVQPKTSIDSIKCVPSSCLAKHACAIHIRKIEKSQNTVYNRH